MKIDYEQIKKFLNEQLKKYYNLSIEELINDPISLKKMIKKMFNKKDFLNDFITNIINIDMDKIVNKYKSSNINDERDIIKYVIDYISNNKTIDDLYNDVEYLNYFILSILNMDLNDIVNELTGMTKIANHVSRKINEEVNDIVKDRRSTLKTQSNSAFLIAKQLIDELPLVPTNDRIYDLTQDIMLGLFDDISDINESKKYWNQWVERTKQILHDKGIIN